MRLLRFVEEKEGSIIISFISSDLSPIHYPSPRQLGSPTLSPSPLSPTRQTSCFGALRDQGQTPDYVPCGKKPLLELDCS